MTAYWATAADVLSRAGKTVTDQQVLEAEAVIEIYANRTNAASASFTARDLVWLNRAVVFQAAWMPDQPGYHQRNSYEEISQDGVSIVYGKEWQISLAPMAARALKNLSWKGARTDIMATIRTPQGARGEGITDFLAEDEDEYAGWEPFSIGAPYVVS